MEFKAAEGYQISSKILGILKHLMEGIGPMHAR
jgi:hypothetical protein